MENYFGEGAQVNQAEVATDGDAKKAAKKEKVQKMKAAYREAMTQNPKLAEETNSKSNTLTVVNTLGYGKNGNIIVDREATQKSGSRVLKQVSTIVGYRVQNTGKEPIPYKTEEWSKGADGKYVAQAVQKTIAPGQTADIARKWLTVLTAPAEFGFVLANGKIVASSKNAKNFEEELASYYFTFSDDDKNVNDDDVKISIDDDNGNIKPEFEAVFGGLANPKERMSRTKNGGRTITAQDLQSNYINMMLKQQGI